MKPRERVLAALEHREPDRVPRWCGASPEFVAKAQRQLGLDDTEQLFVRLGDDFRRVFARYAGPDGSPTEEWPWNPNGSPGAIAGVCDPSGRLFGLMPHPDAFLYGFQHPMWPRRRIEGAVPDEGDGVAIFRNGVDAAAAGLGDGARPGRPGVTSSRS